MGVVEKYGASGRAREVFVSRHFLSLIPCQGLPELFRQTRDLVPDDVDHGSRVTDPGEAFYQRKACVSFDERDDHGVFGPDNEITFPMPRDSTIESGSRPVRDSGPANHGQFVSHAPRPWTLSAW